jgi:small subunit ribosomal protein S17
MARQTFAGLVVSQGKMSKTIKVRVQRVKFNRLVQKDIVHYKDFLVHDEAEKCKEGDVVRIEYVKKFSPRKAFAVTAIMRNKGTEWMRYQQEAPAKVAREEVEKLQNYKAEQAQRQGAVEEVETLRKIQKDMQTDPEFEKKYLENSESIEKLKEKYNLSSWPPTHEMANLNLSALKNELDELQIEIEKKEFLKKAKEIVEKNPEKANQILKELGREDAKPGAKKNIIATYYQRQFEKAANM